MPPRPATLLQAHLLFHFCLPTPMMLHCHTFSAFWLWSSVVSVLISVTTDMSPTGDLIVTSIFAGEMSSWACSGTLMCCASLALFWLQLTLRGNKTISLNSFFEFSADVWQPRLANPARHLQAQCCTRNIFNRNGVWRNDSSPAIEDLIQMSSHYNLS